MEKSDPSDSVELTILVDNNVAPPQAGATLLGEHGFSLWIKTDNVRILFDTGQAQALEHNARALHIPLEHADMLVLSHGHYDHTGAVPFIVGTAPSLRVYCHAGAVQPRYAIRDGEARSIGMPRASMKALNGLPPNRLNWITTPLWLTEHIGLTGPIPRTNDYEDTGGPFFLDTEGARPDAIEDDLALWIKTAEGLVVCAGCSHSGIVNTLAHIIKITGENRIHTLIGGMHLHSASQQRLSRTVQALHDMDIHQIIPCHCTGGEASQYLHDKLSCIVYPGYAGLTLRLPHVV